MSGGNGGENEGASALSIVVFYGSVRSARVGIQLARCVCDVIGREGHNVTLIDPQVYAFGVLDKMYKERAPEEIPPAMHQLATAIRAADGFVVVSGEYNHSIPPALTNLMDHFLEEYFYRPTAIITYSATIYGGVRAAMQLRAFLAEIGTVTLLGIPRIDSLFDDAGKPLDSKLEGRIIRQLREFEWYARALKGALDSRPH